MIFVAAFEEFGPLDRRGRSVGAAQASNTIETDLGHVDYHGCE